MDEGPLDKSNARFFVNPASIDKEAKQARIVDSKQVSQIIKVLRLGKGAEITLLDGKGFVYKCLIRSLANRDISLDIIGVSEGSGELPVKVTVAMPLLRGGRFEWALQKLTELGVHSIIPIVAERSVVRFESGKHDAKLDRWTAICREAAEQSERSFVPVIDPPVRLSDLLAPSAVNGIKILCAERSHGPLLSNLLMNLNNDRKISGAWTMNILIVIGPEGGFTEDEIRKADQMGFTLVSLGSRILRSETAGVYALAQVITILGDTGIDDED